MPTKFDEDAKMTNKLMKGIRDYHEKKGNTIIIYSLIANNDDEGAVRECLTYGNADSYEMMFAAAGMSSAVSEEVRNNANKDA